MMIRSNPAIKSVPTLVSALSGISEIDRTFLSRQTLSAARRKSNRWLRISIVHHDSYLSVAFLRISHNYYSLFRHYFRFCFHRSKNRSETIHGLDGIPFPFLILSKDIIYGTRILVWDTYHLLYFAIYYSLYRSWEISPVK